MLHADDLMRDLPRLDARFGQCRIDIQVRIQEVVAEHRDPQRRKPIEKLVESLGRHASHRFMIA
ncbi:MAG TPA: hypothetical protein DCQ98_21180 [Planctomycetaceae bacterium]|nr:hypothetical protein [Planctomycetaceae bacterium]